MSKFKHIISCYWNGTDVFAWITKLCMFLKIRELFSRGYCMVFLPICPVVASLSGCPMVPVAWSVSLSPGQSVLWYCSLVISLPCIALLCLLSVCPINSKSVQKIPNYLVRLKCKVWRVYQSYWTQPKVRICCTNMLHIHYTCLFLIC